jgi:hypothetical protein
MATEDYDAYDQTIALIQEQTASLTAYRELLAKCQAENKKLLAVLQYYGNTPWKELSMLDRGEAAQRIITEVAG